eukprot:6996124-Alexandrium_andersonii.AAC.1
MWRLAQASWCTTGRHPYNGEIAAAAGIGTSCSSSRNKCKAAARPSGPLPLSRLAGQHSHWGGCPINPIPPIPGCSPLRPPACPL